MNKKFIMVSLIVLVLAFILSSFIEARYLFDEEGNGAGIETARYHLTVRLTEEAAWSKTTWTVDDFSELELEYIETHDGLWIFNSIKLRLKDSSRKNILKAKETLNKMEMIDSVSCIMDGSEGYPFISVVMTQEASWAKDLWNDGDFPETEILTVTSSFSQIDIKKSIVKQQLALEEIGIVYNDHFEALSELRRRHAEGEYIPDALFVDVGSDQVWLENKHEFRMTVGLALKNNSLINKMRLLRKLKARNDIEEVLSVRS